ncbi:MAG: TfoX/Sxy family protein [Muribaculaceae bacterium]|nr:TfoX/Sxy family protein [Muribaculaceae bacterium]
MATSAEFIQFVSDQVQAAGNIRYRKMFGEYMLYCDDRPVLLVCDDTVYVKQMPATLNIFTTHGISPELGIPYNGAKPHYILDIENADLAIDLVRELARILPLPKSATRKNMTNK